MGVFSGTAANAYADQIKAVYEYLHEIKKVADRLTPVEDMTIFQTQIEELHARLDLLVEASTLIVTATEVGELILTGSVPSIRALLGVDDFPDWLVTLDQLEAAINGANQGHGAALGGIIEGISTINIMLTELDQYRVVQQSQISGLQISYENVAAGLETNQLNTESVLQRLTVQEQFAVLVDTRLDSISQSLDSTILGVQAANDVLSGHTATINSALNSISLHTSSIDQLSSSLNTLGGQVSANATALSLMSTDIQSMGDDLIAQSQQTTALKSVIGGSGNLLPNADFAIGASGWEIVAAEEDWLSTVITTNTYPSMPPDLNCLELLGAPSPLGEIVVESPPVLVEGNAYYIVSGYPCVDNGTISLVYKAYDSLGVIVAQGACPPTFNVTTNPNFNNYTRTWVKFQAPASAVRVRLYLIVTGDGDWIVQSALFRPMVEKAWAEQAGPSAWTPNIGDAASALSTALETLQTSVESIDGALTSQAASITLLQSQVSTLPTVYLQPDEPTGGSYNVGDIWFETDNGNKQYIWNGTEWGDTASISGNVNYAQPTMPTGGTYNVGDQWIDTSNNNRLYRWNGTTWVDVSDSRITAQASALSELTTRVSNVEGINSSQSTSILALQNAVADPVTGLASRASASAVSELATRVTAAEGNILSQSQLITNLQSAVNNTNLNISGVASALSSLTTKVTESKNELDMLTKNLMSRLEQIQADNILSPDEKPQVILDYQAIIDEKAGIEAEAIRYGVTTEKTNYLDAVAALTAYMATLTYPTMWNDVTGYTNLT